MKRDKEEAEEGFSKWYVLVHSSTVPEIDT